EVDIDALVIAVALAGAVVPRVPHGAVVRLELAEPDHVDFLAVRVEEEEGGVEVDVVVTAVAAAEHLAEEALLLLLLNGVPAETDHDLGEAGTGLGERD